MRPCIHCGFHQMALSTVGHTYPRFQMEHSRMFHEFLTKYHTAEFPGPETRKNQGLNLEFRKLKGPGHDCIHLHQKCFLLCHDLESTAWTWTQCSANTTGSHWRLQRKCVLGCQSFCHQANPLCSLTCPFICSDVIPSLEMGGCHVWSLRMTSMSFSLCSMCDVVIKSGFLLPTHQKPSKRPAS